MLDLRSSTVQSVREKNEKRFFNQERKLLMGNDLERVQSESDRELILVTSIPPSVNHMYYNTRGGGKRLTKKAEQYFYQVKANAIDECFKQDWLMPDKGVWLEMELAFYFPDKRIRDSHNCLKILIDALQGTVFVNDYYIMPVIKLVELDRENPRTIVKFRHKKEKERQEDLQYFNSLV
jgi:crossover junction endodeoxyribonuclease RusA